MVLNNLPTTIPIFPLSNAIFFPRTVLPLNIFEKRYIQLVRDCMKEEKLFGMVQPNFKSNSKFNVYKVGCLGKIINFNETNDNRFIISLSGIIRYKIKQELYGDKLYRKFKLDYKDFENDLNLKKNETKTYNTKNLFNRIKILFRKKNYFIDWSQLQKLNFDELISTICMISPFSAEEKQKLMETILVEDKLNVLEEIININLLDNLENKTIQ